MRAWFDGLDPELRPLVLQVIAISGEPSDTQLAEAPDLISRPWQLDAIGIPAARRPALVAAIDQLARRLATTKPRQTKPKKQAKQPTRRR